MLVAALAGGAPSAGAQEIQITGPLVYDSRDPPAVFLGTATGLGVAFQSTLGAPFSETSGGVAPAVGLPSLELHWTPRRHFSARTFELGVSVQFGNVAATAVSSDAFGFGADLFLLWTLDRNHRWLLGPGAGLTVRAGAADATVAPRLSGQAALYFGGDEEPRSVGLVVRPWIETSLGNPSWGIGAGAVALVELSHLVSSAR